MAIYHLSATVIKRSQGRSATAAAAYRSAERIHDEQSGETYDYTRKQSVDHTEILAPENSPEWAKNRHQLWNQVEQAEKRKDAQLCREINVALPQELSNEANQKLITEFAQKQFVEQGMVADIALHDLNSHNPHAHIMLTLREIDENGFGKKNREWNQKETLAQWRKSWSEHVNRSLEQHQIDQKIDHRSYETQGKTDQLPTLHEGPKVTALRRRDVLTDRAKENDRRQQHNAEIIDFQRAKERRDELHRKTQTREESGRTGGRDSAAGRSVGDVGRSGSANADRPSRTDPETSDAVGRKANDHREKLEPSGERDARSRQGHASGREPGQARQRIVFLANVVDGHRQRARRDRAPVDRIVALARSVRADARQHELPDLETRLAQIQQAQAQKAEQIRQEQLREAKRLQREQERQRVERYERERLAREARRARDRERGRGNDGLER